MLAPRPTASVLTKQAAASRKRRGVPRSVTFCLPIPPPEREPLGNEEDEELAADEEVQAWCETLWPGISVTPLQLGVVDFLVHENRCKWDPQPGLEVLGPIVQSTVTDEHPVPEDGPPLAAAIATHIRLIRDWLTRRGPRRIQPPDKLPIPPPPRHRPFPVRNSTSMQGSRVAPIDVRSTEPRGIRSGRLHALTQSAVVVGQNSDEVRSQLSNVQGT